MKFYVVLGGLLTLKIVIKMECDRQLASIRQQHARERAIGDMQNGSHVRCFYGKLCI